MKILLLFSTLVLINLYNQVKPDITIFQSNLIELSNAFDKRDYQKIDKLLHQKKVRKEMMKKEVEFSINDSFLPTQAIWLMNKVGQFGSLISVIQDEIVYKRYLAKAGVDPKNCFGYFYEKDGVDVFVIAEWKETYFRLIKIRNLKELLN